MGPVFRPHRHYYPDILHLASRDKWEPNETLLLKLKMCQLLYGGTKNVKRFDRKVLSKNSSQCKHEQHDDKRVT